MKSRLLSKQGYLSIQALVLGGVGVLILSAIIGWTLANSRAAQKFDQSEQAFHIAEAGVEYYRWHLAHASTDYQDGTGAAGPYVHDYFDKDHNKIGTFSLTITPPPVGSTVVRVVSVGQVLADSSVSRTVETVLAIPSLAKYAVAANAKMRFGQGTEVFGPIHSNDGIRFDGLAHNLVTSAKSDYDDEDHTGGNEFGVHTHVNAPPGTGVNDTFRSAEAPPASVPARTDVFSVGRQFPVPAVDFAGLSYDLATIKNATLPAHLYGASGVSGYLLVLKTNDTYDLYKVNSLAAVPSRCSASSESGWGSWSVGTTQSVATGKAFPANGLLFFQDNVWVEGQINGARLTIAAAKSGATGTDKSITINHNLKYTNYDGSDVIGLIAEGNVNVGLASDDDLRIDAALVAKDGRVGRYYYETPDCEPYASRHSLTLYGMIATNGRYGFAFTDGTGYDLRNISYDGHLLYGPPPSFPLTSDSYQTISWREL